MNQDIADSAAYTDNNIAAAAMLEEVLQGYISSPIVSDKKVGELRLLLADAYYNAHEYNKSIVVLSDIMFYHPQLFDLAEQRINYIRQVRSRFNDLLEDLITELGKDPNDPDDPFDEENALAIIQEMEDLELSDAGTDELITSNKRRVKIAVDRGYRDEILELAHQLILEGRYQEAIDRYLVMTGIDTKGFYETSFDLQQEEFQISGIDPAFIAEVDALTVEVIRLSDLYDPAFSQGFQESTDFVLQLDQTLPADPLLMASSISLLGSGGIQASRSANQNIDTLFSALEGYHALRLAIDDAAMLAASFPDELESRLNDGSIELASEYLAYIKQFVDGPARYENEGIKGAVFRQSREISGQLLQPVYEKYGDYAGIFLAAYSEGSWEDVIRLQDALTGLTALYIQLSTVIGSAQVSADVDSALAADAAYSDDRLAAYDTVDFRRTVEAYVALANLQIAFQPLAAAALPEGAEAIAELQTTYSQVLQTIDDLTLAKLTADETYQTWHQEISLEAALELSLSRQEAYHNAVTTLDGQMLSRAVDLSDSYLALMRGETPANYDAALEAIASGDELLNGVAQEGAGGLIFYYPGQALDIYTETLTVLEGIVETNDAVVAEIDALRERVQNSGAVVDSRNQSATLAQDARDTIASLNQRIAAASDQTNEAASILEDARYARSRTEQFISNLLYDEAEDQFNEMLSLYLDSLDVDRSAEVEDEFNELRASLAEDLRNLEIRISSDRKQAALAEVVRYFLDRDYTSALDALNDAEEWHERIDPDNPDPVIAAYRDDIVAASLVSQEQELSEFDPQYPILSSYLNNASTAVVRAGSAAQAGNSSEVSRLISIARENLDAVTLLRPANFEAALIDLRIQQIEMTAAQFTAYFNERRDGILSDIRNENTGEGQSLAEFKTYALTQLNALNEVKPGDSLIENQIIDLEVDLGLRESPQEIAARNRSNTLLTQARSVYNSAESEADLTRALGLAEQSLEVYNLNINAAILIDDIKTDLGREPSFTPSAADLAALNQAGTEFYVNNRPQQARQIIDELWANTNNQRYKPLRDLREEVYRELRLPLNGG